MIAEQCGIEGCERQCIARGWCHMHYQRWYARNPTMNFREAIYQDNKKTGLFRIPLTKGMISWVDECDYEELKQYKWHVTSVGYAARRVGKGPIILMHRQLLNATDGVIVDHVDGDKAAYGEEEYNGNYGQHPAIQRRWEYAVEEIHKTWHSKKGNNWKAAIDTAYDLLPKS